MAKDTNPWNELASGTYKDSQEAYDATRRGGPSRDFTEIQPPGAMPLNLPVENPPKFYKK